MSRQDKATTDRNARTLRDLVKQGDNKNCADCKKNDARWASWNLGVYLCIRCSGIHRSMGTHISKVKSIDLDIWQPEQMDSMKKWGNRRANLYWEAYLKAGHHPPDHKIESFIRSKYEARKWALSGRIPSDPSVLEEEGGGQAGGSNGGVPRDEPPRYDPSPVSPRPGQNLRSPTATMTSPPAGPPGRSHPLLSSMAGSKSAAPPMRTKAPEVDLLSGDFGGESVSMPTRTTTGAPAVPGNRPAPSSTQAAPAAVAATPAPTAKPTTSSSLFDLDFKPPSASATANKTSNQDILSLFSSAPPQPVRQSSFGDFGGFGQAPQPQQSQQQQYQQQPPPQQYQSQSSYQPQQQYSQPQQQQQQQSSSAIYGQSDSYNAPPVIQSNSQAGYASWNSGSGVTSPITQTAGSAGAGMGALSTGFSGMKMGNDPWSSAAPAQTTRPPTTTSSSSAQPPSSNANNSGSTGNANHFVSSQDVWGGTALPAPILDTGFQFEQVGQPAQKKVAEDDPFQNIWN